MQQLPKPKARARGACLTQPVRQWAWDYAADVIRADATAGYFDTPEGFDRQACIEALCEVANAMKKKAKPN